VFNRFTDKKWRRLSAKTKERWEKFYDYCNNHERYCKNLCAIKAKRLGARKQGALVKKLVSATLLF